MTLLARPCRILGVLGSILALLCACTTKVDKNFSFDSATGRSQAVVVAGIAITRYDTTLLFRLPAYDSVLDLALNWQEYDPKTGMLVPGGKRFEMVRGKCEFNDFHCDFRKIDYVSRDVVPGDYVLGYLSWLTREHLGLITVSTHHYYAVNGVRKGSGLFGIPVNVIPDSGPIGDGALRYHFEPGQIAYVGDLTVDLMDPRGAHVDSFARNDDGARGALAHNANLRDTPPIFTPPTDKLGQPLPVLAIGDPGPSPPSPPQLSSRDVAQPPGPSPLSPPGVAQRPDQPASVSGDTFSNWITMGAFGAAVGTEYRDTMPIGSIQLPLLDGTWILAGKGGPGSAEDAVSLVRIENGKLWGIIRVWTNTRPVSKGYAAFGPCNRTNVVFTSVISNVDHGNQDCWVLNHYDMVHARETSTQRHQLDSYAFLDQRGIAVPLTMIVGDHRIATQNRVVTVWYQVNPELAGFPAPPSAEWQDSAWHRDRLAQDPARVAYIEAFKQQHVRYQALLRQGFQGALVSMAGTTGQ